MTSLAERTRAAWTAALRTSPVLRFVAEQHVRRLIDEGELRDFADGAELIHPNDARNGIFLVVAGACDVERADGTVRAQAPAMVGVLDPQSDPARAVRAVGPVRAVSVEHGRFLEAVRTSAAAGHELGEVVADRLVAPHAIRQVGRFPVESIVAEGASGRVLRARHPLLGIPIALKMLSHARALSAESRRAFIREASLLVQIDHPGIVRVLDVFEALGTFFIVMPWIEGATLGAHMDGASEFRQDQVLRVADEGLAALAALHAAGLVHRDVKPSNLFINSSGRLVVIDLGVACERDTAPAHRQLVGSPAYCSPEQILGQPVDGRSDVYSLACTLYELVFGRPPFDARDVAGTIERHLHGTVSFGRSPLVPMGEPFMRWLEGCLSRTRDARPDAVAARAELRHLLPRQVVERPGWHGRASAAFPVLRDTVEWRVPADTSASR